MDDDRAKLYWASLINSCQSEPPDGPFQAFRQGAAAIDRDPSAAIAAPVNLAIGSVALVPNSSHIRLIILPPPPSTLSLTLTLQIGG